LVVLLAQAALSSVAVEETTLNQRYSQDSTPTAKIVPRENTEDPYTPAKLPPCCSLLLHQTEVMNRSTFLLLQVEQVYCWSTHLVEKQVIPDSSTDRCVPAEEDQEVEALQYPVMEE
jgi:hypothetical protein